MTHRTTVELRAGLDHVRRAPAEGGAVVLIVSRPDLGQRALLQQASLTVADGLESDNWRSRGSRHTADGSAEPARQLTIMNARAAALVAGSDDHDVWALAGDQIYVDLDISHTNLPAGTRLRLGTAVVEISEEPHTGCAKFSDRFGIDAVRFVNTPEGKELRLRGLNAVVIEGGVVAVGDIVEQLAATVAAN